MTGRNHQGRSNLSKSSSNRLRRSEGVRRHTVEPLEARTLFASIADENLLPGTPQSQWDVARPGDTTLEGFATDISINQGETISFKVNDTTLTPYRIDIYRMGYYQGMGARLVGSIPESQTVETIQPAPLLDASTGLLDAGNWSVSASWQVPADATSGIYFGRLTRLDNGGGSHVVFIVRDDNGGSDLLFQTSDATWQSYNTWGGQSLYSGSSDFGGRAVKVSYNRPFNTRYTVPLGRDYVFGPEFAMVRWLEANGYDVSYSTNIDTERRGEEIKEHKVFLSVGHDEYWSTGMRNAVESARDAGVNLGFFSGNEVYWKMRWESAISADGTPYRTMVSYKETRANAKIDPHPEWTGTWRDPRFSPPSDGGRPENGLIGQIFTVNRGPGGESGTPFNVPAEFSNLRFWRNTSVATLTSGQVATLGDIVLGYEWDEDLDNGFRPAGLVRMSRTTQTVPQKLLDYGSTVGVGEATHTLTQYRAPSGALVFGAGTVQWSYGLDGTHDGLQTKPDPAMRQATVNIFADMGVQPATLQPGQLRARMSTDVVAPTSTIFAPSASASIFSGTPVTVSGTAADTGGGVVGGVEVSTDGGLTWRRAEGRDSWTYSWTPSTIGPTTILSRAADDSGNVQSVFNAVTVTITPQPTSALGLVGAWSFNAGSGATAADSSGSGNNGTISGAAWTGGIFGGGLLFDGINDWVTVNDATSLDLTNGMTLEAWVRPAAVNTWRNVIMKEQTNGLSYALYSSNDVGVPEGNVNVGGDRATQAGSALALNAWSHLATTYDGTLLKLYVNGSLAATQSAPGTIATTANPLRFGGNADFGEFFQGVIDEVRIYNRPLSEGEIQVNMSTPIGGSLDAIPPTASLSSPANGASVSGDTALEVSAADNVGVKQVEFMVNGALLGIPDIAAPYSMVWRTTQFANGSYTITARARDLAGNSVTSASRTLIVNNAADQIAPTVVLKHPSSSSLVSGTIPAWAVASDGIGVAGVQFRINGVNAGAEDRTAPYQSAIDTTQLSAGSHTLTAVARDAAGNLTVSAPVTIVVDNTPPVLLTHSPAPGATGVPSGTPIRLTFDEAIDPASAAVELRNSNGALVAGDIVYDASTYTVIFTPLASFIINSTYTATLLDVRDPAGSSIASPVSWSFTSSAVLTGASIWGGAATPAVAAAADASAVELGVRFRSELDGYITGVRFYKGGGNGGTHVGRLWTNAGQLLGSVTFVNETATGWQQANFATPIAIALGVTYVVSYHAPIGGYSVTSGYFATAGYDGGTLEALASVSGAGNGVYRYGAGGVFPNTTTNSTNYWVDAVFSTALIDVAAPAVAVRFPASSGTDVPIAEDVTATFSEDVLPGTISFVLRDPGGAAVPASFRYASATFTAVLDPSASLAYNTTYTATVSGASDVNGNVMTPASWSFTTGGPDLTPPSIASQTPAPGATSVPYTANVGVTFSEGVDPATLLFELRDATNQLVSTTVSYEAATRTATLDPVGPLSFSSNYTVNVHAADLSGNLMSAPATWSFTTQLPILGATIWAATTTPATLAATDAAAVELGVKFRADANGYITGIRFYKGTGNTGTHVGRLWSSTGTLLRNVTFIEESASGWQQAEFGTPVAIIAGQTYVASYYAPVGRYSVNAGFFAASGTTSGPLTALKAGVDGPNGLYRYGTGGGFPSSTYNSSNYWVDVAFSSTLPVDTKPPSVESRSPAPDQTGVSRGTNVSVSFSEVVTPATISLVVRDASNNVVAGVLGYDAATQTATFDPTGALAYGAVHTVTLSGATDAAGNVMADVVWSFTVTPPLVGATIWSDSVVPATTAVNDGSAIELGVKFRADSDGYITGVRFYKGTGNDGTHLGRLWTSAGALLAGVTFTNETATGWQRATFATPVAITAGQTYVASYYAPIGRYAIDGGYFARSGATSGPLTALAAGVDGPNGIYRYGAGGGFPTSTYNSGNYWVDVLYDSLPSDTVIPSVTGTTPAAGATGVLAGANIAAIFDEAVVSSSISMVLRDASNSVVAGLVAYDGASRTVTLDPSADLAEGATYTVELSGARDTAGNMMVPVSWSFITKVTFTGATIWSNAILPATESSNDTAAIEVGVKFRSSVNGYITGIRFYKGATNTGTHVGHLWTSSGTLLATVTFTGESASGWQQANFDVPVAVNAGQTYIASYYAPAGGYAVNSGYFTTSGVTSGPLAALANGIDGVNGVYRYGVGGGFPTSSSNAGNYWVDVVFSNAMLTVSAISPADGATGVATSAVVTAAFSFPILESSLSFVVRDATGGLVPGLIEYDRVANRATFRPTALLSASATYTVTVGASDVWGNPMSLFTWVFSTGV